MVVLDRFYYLFVQLRECAEYYYKCAHAEVPYFQHFLELTHCKNKCYFALRLAEAATGISGTF